MSETEKHIISSLLLLCAVVHLFFIGLDLLYYADIIKLIGLVGFVIFYFRKSKRKSLLMGGFLSTFAVAECVKFFFDFNYSQFSNVTNPIYMIGYLCCIIYMLKIINIRKVLKHYWLHLILVLLFNSFIVYNMNEIMFPDVIQDFSEGSYLKENLYNIIALTYLTVSFGCFLYEDNVRNLLLFTASVFVVSSELIQVPYLFWVESNYIKFTYSLFLILGFSIFYIYVITRYNRRYSVLELSKVNYFLR